MKYVAFLDILGFKNIIDKKDQETAKNFIMQFSKTIFRVFQNLEGQLNSKVKGYIVSDSLILYSNDSSKESLVNLIEVVETICRDEYIKNGILIRGGISKGDFAKIKASELPNLEKALIVGKSYVKAYELEGANKVIGINLSEEVYLDILEYDNQLDRKLANCSKVKSQAIKYGKKADKSYLFKYITLDFLLEDNNLSQFVNLANQSNWLEHYYNTLSFALQNERSSKKKKELFVRIVQIISDNKENSLDLFIENAFKDGVVKRFKTYFLKYISKTLLGEIQ
ncbi:hypothetical protein [uncultured Veillonella sp.]|uniref:hypothetical protein n=1 Tax=uncultured Veillonella sp. TaxID=159268 RepID=UPI0025D8CD8A|nr:hypothetical protein [uncultured Veillonella sp.]